MEAIVFYNLISEATEHHFCHILLVTLTNLGKMWGLTTQGQKHQEEGITAGGGGSKCDDWIAHCPSPHLTLDCPAAWNSILIHLPVSPLTISIH